MLLHALRAVPGMCRLRGSRPGKSDIARQARYRNTAKLTGTDALAGTILNDATFKDTWTNTVANLKAASEQLTKDGTGSLSRILHDQELATKMDSAVSSIASISSSIENGPGTLNSLIKDPGLYEEARETLTLLRDSTEDLREQEPVTAFFSILFAPF
jgi:phospholipid/cholesterol/gamma-HCH transport system substrate-binding protein